MTGEVTPRVELSQGPTHQVLRGWRLLGASLLVLACAGIGRNLGMMGLVALVPREVPLEADGLALSAGILVASTLASLAMWLVLRSRNAPQYLAIERPTLAQVGLALAGSAVLVVLFDAARFLTTGSIVPAAWPTLAASAPVLVLVVAFAIAAPCFEEAFFRGFLHTSLRETRLGVPGTIALTSILFTLAHGPEDALSLLDPLASAVFLALLREHTRSIVPGIVAHAFGNLQAIVVALVIG
ncbi:MAG: CPBP family intramembrane metalloprotease [Sandaracinaceae bacterium]|jgi:membrane protease YdiL (CAAX protease family)|nr:CPBP family intramembrane metalloprotease [Sandaracinaceae bacterium]